MNPLLNINGNVPIDFNADWEVHHSTLNGRRVSFAKNQEGLIGKYDTEDGNCAEIVFPGIFSEEKINALFRSKVVLERGNAISFNYPISAQIFEEKEIFLISGNESLVWQVFDKTLKEYRQVSFDSTLFSKRCSEETREGIAEIKTKSVANQARFFKDFKVVDLNNAATRSEIEELNRRLVCLKNEEFSTNHNTTLTRLDSLQSRLMYYSLLFGATKLLLTLPSLIITAASIRFFYAGKVKQLIKNSSDYLQNPIFLADKALDQNRKNLRRIQEQEKYTQEREKCLKSLPINIHESLAIEIEPISAPSKIDPRVLVSSCMWAVTLVCHQGSEGNHAQIIVEGVNNGEFDGLSSHKVGEYFMHFSDFNSSNNVRSQQLRHELEYEQRTRIWKVPSKKVVAMLDEISKQIKNLNSGDEYLEYRPEGPSEAHPNAHNCFSWTHKNLKDAKIVDLGTKTLFGLGLYPNRTKNYMEYGSFTHTSLHNQLIPVVVAYPLIYYNNTTDELDNSDSSIKYRESI